MIPRINNIDKAGLFYPPLLTKPLMFIGTNEYGIKKVKLKECDVVCECCRRKRTFINNKQFAATKILN